MTKRNQQYLVMYGCNVDRRNKNDRTFKRTTLIRVSHLQKWALLTQSRVFTILSKVHSHCLSSPGNVKRATRCHSDLKLLRSKGQRERRIPGNGDDPNKNPKLVSKTLFKSRPLLFKNTNGMHQRHSESIIVSSNTSSSNLLPISNMTHHHS